MKKPNMIAIEIMAGKGRSEENGSYKEPMSKSEDMSEDTAEGEDTTEWECPECGTSVEATMPKKSMSCPCCGADMEMS